MKILDVNKIREADAYTIKHEPISSIDLMERAGTKCSSWIKKKLKNKQRIYVFTGSGNNGGDGLVIARQLFEKGYDIHLVLVLFTDTFSSDFKENLQRIDQLKGLKKTKAKKREDLPPISENDIVIDAIFGSGLNRKVLGFAADAIHHINNSGSIIVSIDIPSGLHADEINDIKKSILVYADYTLSLQFPKYSFMFPESEHIIGQLVIIDIGIHQGFINNVEPKAFLMNSMDVSAILKPRSKFSHKGTYGHALLISGSYGKMGAAVLAAQASLRSGLGLLTSHIPKSGLTILQTAVPECMLSIDENEKYFSKLPAVDKYNAIGVGPGLGIDKQSQNSLKLLIQEYKGPLVLDADALNILSENKTWISFLSAGTIITPHPKEFERLVGNTTNSMERVQKQINFAIKHKLYVVLKGANTSIATPEGKIFFNSTGNPGMATAGSGDVLTGIILSLLAQNYSSLEAALLGVFIHGLAGDYAAKKKGYEALIASDIVHYLGKAFKELY